MNNNTAIANKNTTDGTHRLWALLAAAAVATLAAALHTFVQATPTVDALMAGNAAPEAKQGLRMMWHGMSAIAWTYPVVLLLLSRAAVPVSRPALGYLTLLNGVQALLYAVGGVWVDGASGLFSLPQWALHAAVAVLAWSARPPRLASGSAPLRMSRGHRVLLWLTVLFAAFNAVGHCVLATMQGWPAELLVSDTSNPSKPELYVMWLFSCVQFTSVPVALVWSLWATPAAGRFVVRYTAVLVTALMVSWATTIATGLGPDLPPIGVLSLGLLAALTATTTAFRADTAP